MDDQSAPKERKGRKPKSVSSVWDQVHKQGDQVNEIAKGQTLTEARLGSLESKFDSGILSLERAIERLSNRQNIPVNYGWYISAAGLLLTGIVAFVLLLNAHTQQQNSRQDTELSIIRNKQDDQLKAAEVSRSKAADERLEIWKEVSYSRGRQDALINRVDDVDNIGSRLRLNNGNRQSD